MTTDTKEIINLAGQLDWRIRNGRIDEAKKSLRNMKTRLKRVEESLVKTR